MRRVWSRLMLCAVVLAAVPSHGQERNGDCRPADLAGLSGWNGVWIAENLMPDVNGREAPGTLPFVAGMKLVGMDAPWNEEGWSRRGASIRLGSAANLLQSGWGFPLMMSAPAPFAVYVSPAATVIVSQYSEVRQIHTDGQPHPSEGDLWPTRWGDSIGCWDGDTLVVDTVAVEYAVDFNWSAPPLSDKARFVERIRMTGPGRLESDITISDPEFLERPWEVHMVYLRHPVIERLVLEGEDSGNNRIVAENGTATIGPARRVSLDSAPPLPSVELDPAELDRVVGRYPLDGTPLVLVVERRGGRLFFRLPPLLNSFMPLAAEAPLRFLSLDGGRFSFVADRAGRVTGVGMTPPVGEPWTGRRASEPPHP